MTPPQPLLLLLTHHHFAAAAAAAGLLLDPAPAPTSHSRKRSRVDTDSDGPVPAVVPPPPPPLPPLPLPPTSPDHYPLAFRVSAPTFHYLSGLLDPLLSHPFLPPATLLALALARLFRVPASAPRAASRRLRRVLLANFRFWLAFPSSDPTSSSSSSPLPSSRILSLAAGFRGDRPDLEVLRLSSLYQELEQGRVLDPTQYLVGDGGGYPLLPWLMVPFQGPAVPGSPEAGFNATHRAMCRPVRRAARSLMGWGAIVRLHEEESPRAAVACIGTCAMLHNVLLAREDYSALAPEEDDETESDLGAMRSRGDGAAVEGLKIDERAAVLRSSLAAMMMSGRRMPS